jgi:hypothetical protein
MNNTNSRVTNPCTECGKERILFKTWDEEIPTYGDKTTTVTRSLTVCPDPECQKVVEKKLAVEKDKRDKIKAAREEKLFAVAEKKRLAKENLADES